MSIIKSFSVGNGDMFYINHNSDNFTIIDSYLSWDNYKRIIAELKTESSNKGICRFISTHPDEDHVGGIDWLDDAMPIVNFYVVKNNATKPDVSDSFKRYCKLRDGEHAFNVYKGCTRKWMNQESEERDSSGINILWPDVNNEHFKSALKDAEDGIAFNNMSLIVQYCLQNGARVMWLGDLETEFMENITEHVNLQRTHIVFASHHGRWSGKIPDVWLEKLKPDIIVLGEAPSRDMHYYTEYHTLTQNSCGDIAFDCIGDRVHVYVSNEQYGLRDWLVNENKSSFDNYIGSLVVGFE